MHILGAISEFERGRIQERVKAGLARARAHGRRLGRPRVSPLPPSLAHGLTVRQAARLWGVSKSTAARRMAQGVELPYVRHATHHDEGTIDTGGISP